MDCVRCKGRGWCGQACPILKRIKTLKGIINLESKDFFGSSPPGVFVGTYNYPEVNTGILAPTREEKTAALDEPERWYKQGATIDDILVYRGQMVLSRFKNPVKKLHGKLIETQQELVQSVRPTDIEVSLKYKPRLDIQFNPHAAPVTSTANLQDVKITENTKIPKQIDRVVNDDLKSVQAVRRLYTDKIPVSHIQKIFSSGLLGIKKNRILVPTRWSITATDDIVSSNQIENIKRHRRINEFQLFENTYLGNHYQILLMPRQWSYELIEASIPGTVWSNQDITITKDYEDVFKRKKYAFDTAGGYYACRIGITEYLEKIRRQATAFVVREVTPEYWAPLGVWVCRETSRGAFSKKPETFDTLEQALARMKSRLQIPWNLVTDNSQLLVDMKKQRTVFDFLKRFKSL